MSIDLELQPILPNGYHNHSSPEKMSGTGSFTTPSPHDLSTDMVGSVPPVYSTVPEAQVEHARYSKQQVKNMEGDPQQVEYTSPVGMDIPNTYDMIPDSNKRTDRSHSHSPGGAPLMAENVLYGAPADEQLKHRTLTIEKATAERQQQYSKMKVTGNTSSLMIKEPGDGGEPCCSGRCCGMCLVLVLVFVVAFIALASLVLVLSIIFRVYPVCDCTNSQEIQELRTQVEQLMTSLPSQTSQPPSSQNIIALINNINDTINSRVDAIENTRVSGNGVGVGTNYSSVISGFNLFNNCTTAIEGICTVRVATPNPPVPCETFEVPVNETGKFTVDVRCIRPSLPTSSTTGDRDAIVTTLVILDNLAQCFCYAANDGLQSNTDCAIEITRCLVPQTVNAELRLSPLP